MIMVQSFDCNVVTRRIDCLIYVDDVIIISNDNMLVDAMIKTLPAKFPMRSIGGVHYFLGIVVA